MEAVKGRRGEYFTGLLNENNEREAPLDYLGRGEVKSLKAEECKGIYKRWPRGNEGWKVNKDDGLQEDCLVK